MANALDAVLQYKAQEAAQQKAQGDSILMATQLFNQARQNAQKLQLKTLLTNAQVNKLNNPELVKSDLNTVQRIAAIKGVKPEGDRSELLSKIADAVNTEREVITLDPLTGEPMKSFTTGPRSIVRKGVMSPEQIQERSVAEGEGKAIVKDTETTSKLSGAIKRLSILNEQFNEALPSGDRTPLEQRIYGVTENIKAKYGLTDNAKLVALQENIRPMAITMIRAFGEVGNLSESEQQGAIDAINQSNLTDKERLQKTRQFMKFALGGARPESIEILKKRKDIVGILDAFGVDIGEKEESKSIKTTISKEAAIAELKRRGKI